MFSNYYIYDKTMYLYINNYYEYGIDFNFKNRINNMKDEIKKIIKNINVECEKVILVIGGIVLATILIIENPKVKDDINLVYVTDNILENKTVEIIPQEVSISKDIEIINVDKEDLSKSSSIKEEASVINNVNDIKENKNIDILINVHRSNGEIITLPIDEYLIGVVGAEMPASFDIEALKVQAIISRTYTLRSIKIGRKLTDDKSTQVYLDDLKLKNKWGSDYDKYYSKIKQAVYETKDIAIYYDNEYIDALFFSTSNGKTEDPKNVWGNSISYLKSVDSSWDTDTTPYLRSEERDLETVLNTLGITALNYSIIRNDSGRVERISFENKEYTGVEFRNLFGLRSADFDIEEKENKVIFTTRGYGHGVGLSQYGANMLAKKGYNYDEIIRHYYTGVEIK